MPYIDLASCKLELGITATTDDSLLSGYITTAQRIIEAPMPLGTGRIFEATSDTTRYADAPQTLNIYDYDGPNYNLLLTDIGDLCSIATNGIVNGDGAVIPSTAYVLNPRYKTPYYSITLKRYSGYVWTYTTTAEAAISITGKWSYSTSAPADIARAALRIVVWMYRSRNDANSDQTVQTDQGIVLPNKMPADIAQVLAGYRSLV